MGEDIIEIEKLQYSYQGDTDNALKEISLAIAKGEFILLTGESGSGKTTLANTINGLIRHFHEGELVGSVFQNLRSQFFTLNTSDEVAFGCQNMSFPREEIFGRIDAAFNDLNINELKDKNIFGISSGEKQKVAIASSYALYPLARFAD